MKKLLEHYEQSAKKYIELLESSDGGDEDNSKFNINEIKDKLLEAKNRIEELNQLKNEVEENGEVSITDPDARHMSVSNNGTDIAHNVQVAVDSKTI